MKKAYHSTSDFGVRRFRASLISATRSCSPRFNFRIRTKKPGTYQGCQIFLITKYQNGKKITKLPQNKPKVHKVNQVAEKYNNCL
jgi:hypothetical protein